MNVNRQMVAMKIEKLLAHQISREEVGWWAYDIIMEQNINYEAGYETLLEDILWSLHYFHDNEVFMKQFYADIEDLVYYLKCLNGEEVYQRSKVVHWRI